MKKQKIIEYALCVGVGLLLYMLAEISQGIGQQGLEEGILRRRPVGQGEEVYQLVIGGLGEEETIVTVEVPEQRISDVKLEEILPQAAEMLCERIKGKNESLQAVSSDLELCRELPEYGLFISWESEDTQIIGDTGIVDSEKLPPAGQTVYLKAKLSAGPAKETIEIPVTVVPRETTASERFLILVSDLLERKAEEAEVRLPAEFEGRALTYRRKQESGNEILILLGILAAVCLSQKEKSEAGRRKKKREDSLLLDYPDMLSRFLVLTGAGYPMKQAFRRLCEDSAKAKKPGFHPLYEEIRIALNQMETGTPEIQAYGDFGRRCGLRCYARFASMITSSLQTGSKNMRKLLEEEMEEAFKQRKDLARRRGEEASARLLLPMFLILGTVMIMVVAPAFLTLG